MKQTITIIFFSLTLTLQAQNSIKNDSVKVQDNFYTECFDNLSHGNEILQKYPLPENVKFCSILECLLLLEVKEEEIQNVATNRLIGIATQLFNRKTPVILVSGMDSWQDANEKNFNVEDEDGIVYISIAECVISRAFSSGEKSFNEQTKKLLSIKRNGT